MNTFQLSCFLAVANTLNFARAAQQMNISQPAITHQIKSLESELNVQLFRRTTRLVELTAEGKSFLADAQSMVAIAAQAKLRFHSPEDKPMERLSIACGSHQSLFLLVRPLEELARNWPNLHPTLAVAPREQLFQFLENGVADVALDIFDSKESRPRITYKPLLDSPIVCVCREDHPLACRESVSVEQLRQQSLIFCNPIQLIPEAARLQWQLAEGKDPSQVHFAASAETAAVLAQAGFGLAMLPAFQVPAGLRRIPISEAPKLSFGAFCLTGSGENDVLKAFLHQLRQEIRNSARTIDSELPHNDSLLKS